MLVHRGCDSRLEEQSGGEKKEAADATQRLGCRHADIVSLTHRFQRRACGIRMAAETSGWVPKASTLRWEHLFDKLVNGQSSSNTSSERQERCASKHWLCIYTTTTTIWGPKGGREISNPAKTTTQDAQASPSSCAGARCSDDGDVQVEFCSIVLMRSSSSGLAIFGTSLPSHCSQGLRPKGFGWERK